MLRRFVGGIVLTVSLAWAAQGADPRVPVCEPGYQIVEEICYQDVCHKVCRVVPDVKKTTKPVYSCKTEDYCLKKCPRLCHCAEDCPTCDHPRTRKILVKKFVTTECPTYKCVVETVVERVPCKVYRKVPCISVVPPPPCLPPAPPCPAVTTVPMP